MPRRPIELGDHGEVNVLAWVQQGGKPAIRPRGSRARAAYWTAETRVQVGEGYAGLVRVRARGSSRAEARAAMERRVTQILASPDRRRAGDAVKLSPRMPFQVYAEQVWLPGQRTKVSSGDRAVGTLIRYEQVLRKQIVPVFGRVAVSRLTTGDIARMLAKQSPSVAKTCRSVLRSVLDAAVIDGVAT